MHKLNFEWLYSRCLTCPTVCWMWHPQAEQGGTERKIFMKWIALVYITPLSSILSPSKLAPDVSLSFHLRGEIARMRECLPVCVCAWGREKESERKRESERDMMVWEKGSAGLTVSSGFRWKQACSQMTSFQPVFHIPASLLALSHKTHHHPTYQVQ